MDQMKGELDQAGTPVEICLLGINETGEESGNEAMCQGRTLPWLQDTADQKVWESWDVTFRDVVILDRENQSIAVFNVTIHDLNQQANYDSLKAILLQAASPN